MKNVLDSIFGKMSINENKRPVGCVDDHQSEVQQERIQHVDVEQDSLCDCAGNVEPHDLSIHYDALFWYFK